VLVTDDQRLPDPCPIAARLPTGSLVVFRHYGSPERAKLAERLAVLCREKRLRLLIAEDLDLAISLRSGLHLPEIMAKSTLPRLRLWHRRNHLLTVAAHGRSALERAARLGADAALLSPVFPTASHPGQPTLGPVRFRALVRRSTVEIYALGGISVSSVLALRESGIAGIAAIGGFAQPSAGAASVKRTAAPAPPPLRR
jgi:thiamine-phosphate pyrophosphorylase